MNTATATSTATAIWETAQRAETTYSSFGVPITRAGGRIEGSISSGTWMNPLEAFMQLASTSNYSVEAEVAVRENGSVKVHYTYIPQHEEGIASYSCQDVRWDGYTQGISAEETWAADIENALFCAQEEVPELHNEAVAHMFEVVADELAVPNDAALRACIAITYCIAPWDIALSDYEEDYAEWEAGEQQ